MVIWLTALLTRTHFFWHVGKQRSALRLSWQLTTFTSFGRERAAFPHLKVYPWMCTDSRFDNRISFMGWSGGVQFWTRGNLSWTRRDCDILSLPFPEAAHNACPTFRARRLPPFAGWFFVFDSRPVFCRPRALASACWMFSPRTLSSDRPVVHVSRDASGISNRNEERNYFRELELDDIYTVKSEALLSSYEFV